MTDAKPKKRPGRKPLSADSPTQPRSIGFPADELEAIDKARGPMQFASWVRWACRKAISEETERMREILEFARMKGLSQRDLADRVRLVCAKGHPCSFHADGGAQAERCPGYCDTPGCTNEVDTELPDGRGVCRWCLVEGAARP